MLEKHSMTARQTHTPKFLKSTSASPGPKMTGVCLCSVSVWPTFHVILTRCNPLDCSPPGSSVYGFLQARILEWGCWSRGSSRSRDQTCVSCTGRGVLFHGAIWEDGGEERDSSNCAFHGQAVSSTVGHKRRCL